jgi:receptor-type tyrosine-protein phosphatase beta
MEKAAQDPERKVTFVDLVPGRLYNITMWTVSGGVTSRSVFLQESDLFIFCYLKLQKT